MTQKRFLRVDTNRHSRLGKGRKKKQKWRRAFGRDNKIRENKRGYPKGVRVGFKKQDKEYVEKIIHNISELEKIETKKNVKIIIGNVGMKKRLEIVKKAEEMKIRLGNLNTKKFLKNSEHKIKKKKPVKKTEIKNKENKK